MTSEMRRLRLELLNDPKVQIGEAVMREFAKDIATAPRDGTVILIEHSNPPEWAEGYWSRRMLHWVRLDPQGTEVVLHLVKRWGDPDEWE
jgi:hypothetical protein